MSPSSPRALAIFLTCLFAVAATARAQDTYEPDQRGDHDDGEPDQPMQLDEQAEGEEEDELRQGGDGYEPDQRGNADEERYEPDQRGGLDMEESEDQPVPMAETSASGAYDDDTLGPRLALQLWTGVSLTRLDSLGGDNLVAPDQRGGLGAHLGIFAGASIGPVTVGPSFDLALDPAFVIATPAIQAQLIVGEGIVQPFVQASLGLAFVLGLDPTVPAQDDTRIVGVSAEIGAGARYRLSSQLFVGAQLSAAYLGLGRTAAEGCTPADCTSADLDVSRDAHTHGLKLELGVGAGLVF